MQTKKKWLDAALYTVLFLVLASLALYAYLGSFTRYMADDYCTAAVLKDGGFWRAQSYWWNNWSGRYSFTFLASFVEQFGVGIVPVLPGLMILVWLLSFVWVLLPFLKNLKVSNSIAAGALIAGVALWVTFRSLDDYPQIVFWQTGILTYPVSIILSLIAIGIAVQRAASAGRMTLLELSVWFLFAFFVGGFSETSVVVQISLLVLLFLLLNIGKTKSRKILSSILLAAILGSVLSLIVIAAAPGNLVRPGGLADMPSLSRSLPGLFIEALVFLPRLFDQHTFVFVFGFLIGGFFLYFCMPDMIQVEKRLIARHFAVSLFIVEVGILACIAPAYLLRVALPPDRVLLSAYFLATCLAIYWGALSALLLKMNLPSGTIVFQRVLSLGILVFLFVWGVRPVMASQMELIPVLKQYSALWDERHQSLLAEAQNNDMVVVSDFTREAALSELGPRLWLSGDFETSPNYWINQCAARYYDVGQISAE